MRNPTFVDNREVRILEEMPDVDGYIVKFLDTLDEEFVLASKITNKVTETLPKIEK